MRTSTACLQCQKRKQKCSRERPCRHCSRRYPPVECVYRVGAITRILSDKPAKKALNQQALCYPDLDAPPNAQIPATNFSPKLVIPDAITDPIYRYCDSQEQATNHEDEQDATFIAAVRAGLLGPGSECQQIMSVVTPASNAQPYREELLLPTLRQPRCTTPIPIHNPNAMIKYDFTTTETLDLDQCNSVDSTHGVLDFPVSVVDSLYFLPIPATLENAKLFHIFIKLVTQYVVSFDGRPSPNYYNDVWIPWAIKIPLLAQLAIHTSACYQAEFLRIPVAQYPVAIKLKLKSIALLNEIIRCKERCTSDEAIAGVVHLITSEWYWGKREVVEAHMKGLNEMIRLRGGLKTLESSPLLYKQVILCDYYMACSNDREPIFEYSLEPLDNPTNSSPPPINLSTPFIPSQQTFLSNAARLDITSETALILDDISFLTHAILTSPSTSHKIREVSTWILSHISSLPPFLPASTPPSQASNIYTTIRLTAVLYLHSICIPSPLYHCSFKELDILWDSIWKTSLERWKKIPGIFLWVILVVNCMVGERDHGRLSKMMVKGASIYLALEDWGVAMGCLRGFVGVQRWLREESSRQGKNIEKM